MSNAALRLYKEHFADKGFERIDLFALLVARFGVRRALYTGEFRPRQSVVRDPVSHLR